MTVKRIFGSGPNQIARNKDLGSLAWQNKTGLNLQNTGTTSIVGGSPALPNASQINFVDAGSSNGYLTFSTTASGTVTERMRIDSSGNVGIGITSPTDKLQLSGGMVTGANASIRTGDSSSSLYVHGGVGARGGQIDFVGGVAVSNAGCLLFRTGTAADSSAQPERMRIDASGNLGLGVTPSASWSSSYSALQIAKTVGLYGHDSAETASVSSNLVYEGVGPSYNHLYLISGYATKLTQESGAFKFYTAPSGTAGAVISFTQAMTLDASGNLLVGTTSNGASARLALNQSADAPTIDAYCGSTTAGTAVALITKALNSTATSNVLVKFYINFGSTGSGQINANGASQAAFGSFSDARLKENVTELEPQLEKLMALRPVEFDYKDGSGHQTGFIAQEFQDVYPDAIGEADGYLTLTGYGKTEARLIKAIQELKAELDELKAKVN